MKKIAILTVLALFACSCKDKEFSEAVTGKRYIPGHDEISTLFIGSTLLPVVNYEPDEWLIFTESHSKSVPKSVFDAADIGDTLVVSKKSVHIKKKTY